MTIIIFIPIYFFVVGVWAAATKRRWVFFTSFATAVFSILILGLLLEEFTATSVVESWGQTLMLLAWGLCFELFLFQICVSKKIVSKILISVVASSILTATITVSLSAMSPSATPSFIYYYVLYPTLLFALYLLVISYVGARLSNILKS